MTVKSVLPNYEKSIVDMVFLKIVFFLYYHFDKKS